MSCVLSLVTGFPASQASWQRENEGVEEERRGLRVKMGMGEVLFPLSGLSPIATAA